MKNNKLTITYRASVSASIHENQTEVLRCNSFKRAKEISGHRAPGIVKKAIWKDEAGEGHVVR